LSALRLSLALGAAGVLLLLLWEFQDFRVQAGRLSALADAARFTVRPGASASVRFPTAGPYDRRLGYSSLPAFSERLAARGYSVERQARFSPQLSSFADWGLPAIYQEKARAGLTILGRGGKPLFPAPYPGKFYRDFDSIPPLLVRALLFAEDRGLLSTGSSTRNPAIEWDRLLRGAFAYGVDAFGFHRPVPGGSTLATQMEKFRHSPGGYTGSLTEKFRQMAAASLRAYQGGEDTRDARRRIVVDYLNGVSLGAIPGYGEVIGVPSGLEKWYGVDSDVAGRILRWPARGSVEVGLKERARIFKQAVSLILAAKRPSLYLMRNPSLLADRTNDYLVYMAKAGLIDEELSDAARAGPLDFVRHGGEDAGQSPSSDVKVAGIVKRNLARDLAVASPYDLNRLDLTVESTLDSEAETRAVSLLKGLHDSVAVVRAGLAGERMLLRGDPSQVVYSVSVYEAGARENFLRVQADNLAGPFNVAGGTKMDLGSTAKLRVLVSYLEVIASLHRRYSGLDTRELEKMPIDPWDPLSRWTVGRLREQPTISLSALLALALARRYSADPHERFVTGGGMQRFHNFDHRFDSKTLDVSTAFTHSVNLVFIRLMRDVLDYYTYGCPGAPGSAAVRNRHDRRRAELLRRFALQEGGHFLDRFYRAYADLDPQTALQRVLARAKSGGLSHAALLRSVEPGASFSDFAAALRRRSRKAAMSLGELRRLYRESSPARLGLADRAYLSGLNPLELWVVGYLRVHPRARLSATLRDSTEARREAYSWLYRTRRMRSQDRRIRQVLESDGFRRLHRDWQRHGYPFRTLVPSLATAIGSSADRPSALAELMGVIVNDGVRKPTRRIERLRFAVHTPYETVFRRLPQHGDRVMPQAVAETVRDALAHVVRQGTGRRASRAFEGEDRPGPVIGGKTGTGDHRFMVAAEGGKTLSAAYAVSRSATFVFYIGDRFYGVVSAYVNGPQSAGYDFTSALATQIFSVLVPRLDGPLGMTGRGEARMRQPSP